VNLHHLALGFFALLASAVCLNAELPTDEECISFGQELAHFLDNQQAHAVVELLDEARFGDAATEGLDLEKKHREAFKVGLLRGLKRSLATQLNQFADARFLRLQKSGAHRRVLVRCRTADGALNYHAFYISKAANGSFRWIDTYVYLSGERLTETIRRAAIPLVAQNNRNFIQKLSRKDADYFREYQKFQQASQLLAEEEYAEALELLESLPKEILNEKYVLALRVRASQPLDDAKYLNVIEVWEKAHPDDPSLDLVSIDGYVLRKDFAGAARTLERLEKRIGGDPYLLTLRGNMLVQSGQHDEAQSLGEKALEAEPDLNDAYDLLLNVSLAKKDYRRTAELLGRLEKLMPRADIPSILKSEPAYAEFRESKEYRDWLAGRERKRGDSETQSDSN
jgi:tetratricopeptide (TPR) repeat protein